MDLRVCGSAGLDLPAIGGKKTASIARKMSELHMAHGVS